MKIMMNKKLFKLGLLSIVFSIGLTSCISQNTRTKSSVVDYLYPKHSETVIQPGIPILSLPLKVGIAFTPDKQVVRRGKNIWTGAYGKGAALTSVSKSELLEKVADNFRSLKFVSEIEVIPSEYLTPRGGFANLEQIKTMYGIDIIALVSYDQVQFTDESYLSLSYWTLIGAYLVSGEINDTSTMLDTVVYDISSKKMLFRAPGTSVIKGTSTPINLSKELRKDSLKGFELASIEMTKNLEFQLDRFKKKIKDKPEQVKIIHRSGYSGGGGGAIGAVELVVLLLLTALIKYRVRG